MFLPGPDAVPNPFEQTAQSTDPRAGLKAFLTNWMMNDLIFLNIAENVTPDSLRQGDPTPWFVVLPNESREGMCQWLSKNLGIESHRVPFTFSRATTAILFVLLAIHFANRAQGVRPERWLEFVFLTMAWFWLLLPTLNPWYWIWALPWVSFARNRVWLGLSGLLFIYYSRFYFDAQPELAVGPYQGAAIFDFLVVWVEYVPWLIVLIIAEVWINQSKQQREALNADA